MAGKSKPGKIHLRIVEVMKRFPAGISGGQIRHELEKEGLEPSEQTHLDRRKRDLKKWFVIKKEVAATIVNGKNRKVTLYKYAGVRRTVVDERQPSLTDRAEVIHSAHSRCQMCGKSVEKHGITLVVDHKKPRDWGGTNDRENLWAICEESSANKKTHSLSLGAGSSAGSLARMWLPAPCPIMLLAPRSPSQRPAQPLEDLLVLDPDGEPATVAV
jgi:5-methylcytosine-specific restriction endonuclease McrA